MNVPPIFVLLFRSLPKLLTGPTIAFLFLRAFQQVTDVSLPAWLVVSLCLLSRFVGMRFNAAVKKRQNEREAAANGAVMGRRVKDGDWESMSKLKKMTASGYPGDVFLDWMDEYGSYYWFSVLGEDRLFTSEPEHIKAILATQFKSFEKGPVLFDQWYGLLGAGVFNSDGETWKFHRTMTRPFFSKDRISDFDIFDTHAEDVLSQIKTRLAEGHPVEFQDAVGRFTLDSATAFLFGKDVCSLSAGLPYPEGKGEQEEHPSSVFVNAFVEGQRWATERARMGPYWRLFEPWKDEIKELRDVMNGFVDGILDEALAKAEQAHKKEDDGENESQNETLLEDLVRHTRDKKSIQDELINMLVAGRDTTAGALTFSVYMMAEHPDVTLRLRQEILSQVGSARRPSYHDLRDMKYLRAFVNEVLRLYPSVPLNNRTTNEAVLLSKGKDGEKPLYIPAYTKCNYSVFIMHRRKDLWGPDAETFDPDRFIDERLGKYLTPNPYIFLPFNAGPRICLGQQFAYNEISFFLVRLLQKFDAFELCEETTGKVPEEWKGCPGTKGKERIRLTSSLTMYARDGLWVRMKEAEK